MVGETLTWFTEPSRATGEELAAIERATGWRLPDDFREFALRFSGGAPNETDFDFADGQTGKFYASAAEFLSLKAADERSILQSMQRIEYFPDGLVPFAADGGGNYVCFDFRTSGVPNVVFWNHGRRGLTDEISLVSRSFEDFIHCLKKPPDED